MVISFFHTYRIKSTHQSKDQTHISLEAHTMQSQHHKNNRDTSTESTVS
jgi:hypothetical protein